MLGLLVLESIGVGESLTGALVLQDEDFLMSLSAPQNRGPNVQQQRFPYPSMMGHDEVGGMPRMAARTPYEDEMRVRFAPSEPVLQSSVHVEQIPPAADILWHLSVCLLLPVLWDGVVSAPPVGKRA